jgi:hypothetical protein
MRLRKKMRLIAIDKNSFYFYAQCSECKAHLFYKSNGMLNAFVERFEWDLDYKMHVNDCVNLRVVKVLGGIYEKKN